MKEKETQSKGYASVQAGRRARGSKSGRLAPMCIAFLLIFAAMMRSQVSLSLMARSHLALVSSFVCCLFWMTLSHGTTQTT